MLEIYLDNNATTPVLPQASAAANLAMTSHFGNPSSNHINGLQARALLDAARQRAKRVLGAGDGQLIFTSGATEGIQIAVLSALNEVRKRGLGGAQARPKVLYGATEHKAVSESICHWNQLLGLDCEIMAIPVDANGRHDLAFLRAHAPSAALICTTAVNNETGVISDLAGIEKTLSACSSPALWLVDSVQALGKLEFDLSATSIDYATFSGHKLYAPKGIGMLYVRAKAPFTPLMVGGGQESALRSGTENMIGIAALNAVLELLENHDPVFQSPETLFSFRDQLIASLTEAFPGIVLNAPLDLTVPTTVNFSVPNLASKELLDLFDAAGVRVSSGSACSSSVAAPSFVLRAMNIENAYAASAVRLSFGPAATQDEISAACARIIECGAALRRACLIPTERSDVWQQEGVLRLEFQGACCWLLTDAASRNCVIIDPIAELAQRIENHVRGQNLQVLAILDTHGHADHVSVRIPLLAALADKLPQDAGKCDSLGWPEAGTIAVTLANGEQTRALSIGQLTLARTALGGHTADSVAYLAGALESGRLEAQATRYAFTGDTVLIGGLGRTNFPTSSAEAMYHSLHKLAILISGQCVICPAHDYHAQFVTTLDSERRFNPMLSKLLCPTHPIAAEAFIKDKAAIDSELNDHPAQVLMCGVTGNHCGSAEDTHIQPDLIKDLLHDLPDTLLVDVREVYEHNFIDLAGFDAPVLNVPLSRLAHHMHDWLGNGEQPLIFFCRSGKRGEAAAQCLRRLGHHKTWSLAGSI
ncbi:aminotransferase class V-fold PLP-dependent enzyme [Undibacterium sp.]|jgi:cysteine desulfurase|uniref:aminotransferase class V-fold PLP-dependent enzyme n=1 Tax=Undibacterium sp. TaxID=1914977 RepID=UPI002BF35AE2|nr:aminotransferase class V-fold PLP-dependent enzyme [Undibacterium sp.]HTD02868.1 aminotransferase class V-fold PLP-dependent enzyme [Undibacterium sp.]